MTSYHYGNSNVEESAASLMELHSRTKAVCGGEPDYLSSVLLSSPGQVQAPSPKQGDAFLCPVTATQSLHQPLAFPPE